MSLKGSAVYVASFEPRFVLSDEADVCRRKQLPILTHTSGASYVCDLYSTMVFLASTVYLEVGRSRLV